MVNSLAQFLVLNNTVLLIIAFVFLKSPAMLTGAASLLFSYFNSVSEPGGSLKLSHRPWPHLTLQVKCQLDFIIALNSFPVWRAFHSWTGDV